MEGELTKEKNFTRLVGGLFCLTAYQLFSGHLTPN